MLRKANEDGFWYSSNEENYHGGPCETRDQAVSEAVHSGDFEPGDVFTTAFCKIHHLQLAQFFDAERFLDDVEDNLVDDYQSEDGDPVFEVTPEQEADLQAMVREAITAWQAKHGLDFTSWYFLSTTQEETHTMPGEPEEHPFPSVGPIPEEQP